MKRKLLLAIAVVSILLGSLLVFQPSESRAAVVTISKTFTGFAFEKSAVTNVMKTQIQTWVNANPDYTMVSCTGYTGNNANKRSKAFIQALAEARSLNVCNFIREFKDGMNIHSTQGIPTKGKTDNSRKVTVRLMKEADSGGGDEGGGGDVVIGVCDNSLNAVMRSRIAAGDFSFNYIIVKNIATTCSGKVMDIYLLDASGNQLAVATAIPITTSTTVTVNYGSFTPSSIPSSSIAKVAFELRAP
jgi:hypothetical protein